MWNSGCVISIRVLKRNGTFFYNNATESEMFKGSRTTIVLCYAPRTVTSSQTLRKSLYQSHLSARWCTTHPDLLGSSRLADSSSTDRISEILKLKAFSRSFCIGNRMPPNSFFYCRLVWRRKAYVNDRRTEGALTQ